MITILNRKELLISYDMKRTAEVREILAANGIEYYVKTVSHQGASSTGFGSGRARMGTFGQDFKYMYEYIIYVKTDDYDKAYYLINKKG